MQSTLRRLAPPCLILSALLTAQGCASSGALPPRADLIAVTEPKPIPGDDIVTDPAASARYNSAVEGWGDRLHSAGVRLCRYFERQGMKLECGE